jgi:hypothetical protein
MAATIVRCDLPEWKTVLSPDLQLTPSPWHYSGLEGSGWQHHQSCYDNPDGAKFCNTCAAPDELGGEGRL